jgi:hypothetical protein
MRKKNKNRDFSKLVKYVDAFAYAMEMQFMDIKNWDGNLIEAFGAITALKFLLESQGKTKTIQIIKIFMQEKG